MMIGSPVSKPNERTRLNHGRTVVNQLHNHGVKLDRTDDEAWVVMERL